MIEPTEPEKHPKRLLVLGASVFQVPLIKRAQALGCEVLATSYREDDPGLAVADQGFPVSILDQDSLQELCRSRGVEGVLTAASDLGTLSVGRLVDIFGYPGLSERQVRSVTDKWSFLQLQRSLGLPHPPSRLIQSESDLTEALREPCNFPLVVKPRYASGSRGVFICHSKDEVKEHHAEVMAASFGGHGYLMQSFLQGREHGAECFIEDGRVVFLELTHKYLNSHTVPVGHCVPFECDPLTVRSLQGQVQRISNALRIGFSPVNLDVFLKPKGDPVIIDCSFRLGGNLLPDLMCHRFGIDTYGKAVFYSLDKGSGKPFRTHPTDGCVGSVIFGSPSEGILTQELVASVEGLFEELTQVIELKFDLAPGERYESFREGSRRFGHALFQVDKTSEYERVLREFQALL